MNRLYGLDLLASHDCVAARLSADAMRLEVRFTSEAASMAPDVLYGLVLQRMAALAVRSRLSRSAVTGLLDKGGTDKWLTLLEASAPSAPVDGRLELLVPVSTPSARGTLPGNRHAVIAGTVLARTVRGVPASPGLDLCERTVPPRAPHEVRLPQGQNTEIGADRTQLLATCDGEVRLRNLQIEVVPGHVHGGDVPTRATVTERSLPLFITGSVLPGAEVHCDGDVWVQGSVLEARVISAGGSITVIGDVAGSAASPCRLQASGSVTCGPAQHSIISAETDIRVLARAWQCTMHAGGNVFLSRTMAESLADVDLHVEGGVLPILEPETRLTAVRPERKHARVGSRIRASIALHSITDLQFRPCTVLDLSTGGARCAVHGKEPDPSPGAVVHMKLPLPDYRGCTYLIARVSRNIGQGVVGVTFLQMTERDRDRLTDYCLQLVLKRPHQLLASKRLRGKGVPGSPSASVETAVGKFLP